MAVVGLLPMVAQLRQVFRCGVAPVLFQQLQAVTKTGQHPQRIYGRLVGQCRQAGAECQQVTGQVTAVDAGDITRVQRLQGAGVVPVVQMATIVFQPIQSVERQFDAPQRVAERQIAEVIGGEVGQ
ncbi:hypothetical protein D3C80_710900 [compost metagenome]